MGPRVNPSAGKYIKNPDPGKEKLLHQLGW